MNSYVEISKKHLQFSIILVYYIHNVDIGECRQMENGAYTAMINRSMDPQVSERTVAYLTEHLGQFLRKNEQVLICFPEH